MDFRTIKNQIILTVLLFIIPLNLYKIANNLGSGIQWALFTYQQSIYGNMIFTLPAYFGYVFSDLINGRSAVSLVLWSIGTFILIATLTLLLFSLHRDRLAHSRWCGILLILAGTCYTISCIAQYGLILKGAAGFCVPLGIPVILIIGLLIYSASRELKEENDRESGELEILTDSDDFNPK